MNLLFYQQNFFLFFSLIVCLNTYPVGTTQCVFLCLDEGQECSMDFVGVNSYVINDIPDEVSFVAGVSGVYVEVVD